MSVAFLSVASILTILMIVARMWPTRSDSLAGYHDAVQALRHAVDRARESKPAS